MRKVIINDSTIEKLSIFIYIRILCYFSNNVATSPNNYIENPQPTTAILKPHLDSNEMDEILKLPLQYYYKMDHKKRGLALIFNHESFLDLSLLHRKGTQVDRDRLIQSFEALDFDVRVFDNLREAEIRQILKKG